MKITRKTIDAAIDACAAKPLESNEAYFETDGDSLTVHGPIPFGYFLMMFNRFKGNVRVLPEAWA